MSGKITQPNGVPGGWRLVWNDEFLGSAIDTTKWVVSNNETRSGSTTLASNVTVANGILSVAVSDATHGAGICSGDFYTPGKVPPNGYLVPVNSCTEALVSFAGTSPPAIDCWPAFWQTVASGNGEIDTAECLGGSLTTNYHSATSNVVNVDAPAGNWANQFFTYSVVRFPNYFQAYWNGNLVGTCTTDDPGGGQGILFQIGTGASGGAFNGPVAMQVKYVRSFVPAAVVGACSLLPQAYRDQILKA